MTQKHNPTKALLLAILIVAGMIVSPVCAASPIMPNFGLDDVFIDNVATLNYNTPDGLAIAGLEIRVPYGTTLSFTLNPLNGTSETGTIVYSGDILSSTHTVGIGSDSNAITLPDPLHGAGLYHIGVASNGSGDRGYFTSFEVLSMWSGPMAYSTVAGATPITSISFTSNNLVNVRVVTESYEKAYTDLEPGGLGDIVDPILKGATGTDWIALAKSYAGAVIAFITGIFWILDFFFIKNLLLIIVLWISVSMAVSAVTTPYRKMPWGFFEKFFRYQRALLDFIVSLWRVLWEIINYIVQIFVKWL
jgi:hypothetical protein